MPVRTLEDSNMSVEVDDNLRRPSGSADSQSSVAAEASSDQLDTFNASVKNLSDSTQQTTQTSLLEGVEETAMDVDGVIEGETNGHNGNGIAHSDEDGSSPVGTSGEAEVVETAAETGPETPKRPRRAAAAAANQKMQRKSTPVVKPAVKSAPRFLKAQREKSPVTETEAEASQEPSEPSSPSPAPKAKRQKRSTAKSDPTFNLSLDVSESNTTINSQEATLEPVELIQSAMKNRKRPGADVVFTSSSRRRVSRLAAGLVSGDNEKVRSLYDMLRQDEESSEDLVDSWMNVYQQGALIGYLELASFLVQSSGCKAKLTFQMANLDNADIIKQLQTKFEDDTPEYPLIKSGQEGRKFRGEFSQFLEKLIDTIKQGILMDDYLMDQLTRFLIELSESAVRPFRHTASLAGVKIMSALVNASKGMKHSLKDAEKLLQVEESKKRQNKEALLMRKKTFEDAERTVDKLHNMFDKLYKGVFCQRYRDVATLIRELCLEELGEWMKRDPERYVDDSYLKYLGWSLYDKEASVRRRSLQSILPVYQQEDNKDRLNLFTNKFKDRLVVMATAEVDHENGLKAMRVCCAMDKLQAGVFLPEDLESLYTILYVMERPLAVATAEFLVGRMDQLVQTEDGEVDKKDRRYLLEMANFVAESGQERHSAYLVDSLMDVTPMVKGWQAMTDLLLEESPSQGSQEGEVGLTDDLARILIAIMCWAIKQVATGEGPVGRTGQSQRKNKAKDANKVQEEKAKMTAHFITALPRLLSKYKEDVRKVCLLISVPQYFDVDVYTTNHKEDDLDALLDLLVEIFERSEELALLKQCTKSLEALEQEGSGVVNRVAPIKSTLAEAAAGKLKEALPLWLAGTSETAVLYAVESSLTRLSALFSTFDLTFLDLWHDLYTILVRSTEEGSSVKLSLVRKIVNCCSLHLTWRIMAFRNHGDNNEEPTGDEIDVHKERVKDFLNLLLPQLDKAEKLDETVSAMFVSVLDLMNFHGALVDKEEVTAWHFPLSNEQQLVLANFVDSHVLGCPPLPNTLPNDVRFDMVHKRRLILIHFCRALNVMTVKPRYASAVFKEFLTNSKDYGDVAKDGVKRLLDISKRNTGEAVAATLVDLFEAKKARLTRNSKELSDLKEAAKRFAALFNFGPDLKEARPAMGLLHKYCIQWITSAESDADLARRVLFFDILVQFAPRLSREDKARIVVHLGTLANLPGRLNADERVPFMQYKNQLTLAGIEENEQVDKHRRGRRVNAPTPKESKKATFRAFRQPKMIADLTTYSVTGLPVGPVEDGQSVMQEAPSAPEIEVSTQNESTLPSSEEAELVEGEGVPDVSQQMVEDSFAQAQDRLQVGDVVEVSQRNETVYSESTADSSS